MLKSVKHKRTHDAIPVPVVIRNGIPVPVNELRNELGCTDSVNSFTKDQKIETEEISFDVETFVEDEPLSKRQKVEAFEDCSVDIHVHEGEISIEPQEVNIESMLQRTCRDESLDNLMTFNVSDKFDSYESFMRCLQVYKEQNCVDFVKRDARTVESASKRLSRVFRVGLMYYEVNLRCVHGGKVVSRAKTNRRTRESLKMGCPAYMTLRCTSDGMYLEIKSLKLEHNHELNAEVIKNRGTTKQLPKGVRDKAQAMLAANVDRDVVCKMITDETGERDTKRIVTNLLALATKSEKQTVLNRVFKKLQMQNDGVIDYFPEKYELKGILFQDSDMRATLEAYPELIIIVSSGKMKERACSHIFLAEDNLGQPEVVGLGILASDKEPNFSNLLELFKVRNPFLQEKLKAVVAERDEATVDHVKSAFPNAACFLTKPAVFMAMKKAINSLRLVEDQKVLILDWISKFLDVNTDSEYSSAYSSFSEDVPKFLDYYNDKWHGIIPSWILGITFRTPDIMLETMSWVSFIADRLAKFENVEAECYVDELFSLVGHLRQARRAKMMESLYFQPPEIEPGSVVAEDKFGQVLTAYACNYVNAQIKVPEVELMETDAEDTFQSDTWEGIVTVTAQSCTCVFHRHVGLPCAHIFACRHYLELDLFDETLFDHRWTLDYLKETSAHAQEKNSKSFLMGTSEVHQPWISESWENKGGKQDTPSCEEQVELEPVTVIQVGDVEISQNSCEDS